MRLDWNKAHGLTHGSDKNQKPLIYTSNRKPNLYCNLKKKTNPRHYEDNNNYYVTWKDELEQ